MKFQLLCLYCDDPLLLVDAYLIVFLNEFRNFILAEHAKNSCPLAQNPQKIFNSGTINTVQ
jgi:hypothetical protein